MKLERKFIHLPHAGFTMKNKNVRPTYKAKNNPLLSAILYAFLKKKNNHVKIDSKMHLVILHKTDI